MVEGSLRIWEVDCVLLDGVLALTFDAEELKNYCNQAGVVMSRRCLTGPLNVFRTAHGECHSQSPLAKRLERLLNYIHRRELDRVASEGLQGAFAKHLGRASWTIPPGPASWAIRRSRSRGGVMIGRWSRTDMNRCSMMCSTVAYTVPASPGARLPGVTPRPLRAANCTLAAPPRPMPDPFRSRSAAP